MRINSYFNNTMYKSSTVNKKDNKSSSKLSSKDTITLSNKGAKQLKYSISDNRKVDNSLRISSYLEKVDEENQKTIDNCRSELKAQVSYKDEFSAYEKVLKDKYERLASIAKSHDNPEKYIMDKYYNQNSSSYVADLSDEERSVAFTNEMQMITSGEISSCDLRDSAFRGLSKKEGLLNRSEGTFHRDLINNQFSKMLKKSGIKSIFEFNITIDPYSYKVNVEEGKGPADEIKKLLEDGNNAAELFKHIILTSLYNGHNNKKITDDGKAKFNLYHQCLQGTGIDVRLLEEKNGTYYTKDGKDIIDVYNEAVDKSLEEGNSYMPKKDAVYYKKWFSNLVHLVSNKGWNNVEDMFLNIKVTNKGFQDIN